MDDLLIEKPDFILCRVDIDIHSIRGDVDMQGSHGILPFHETAAIAFKQPMVYHPVVHITAVDEKVDAPCGGSGDPRRRNPPGNGNRI